MLSGPPPPFFACNTQSPPPPPRCVRTKWKAPFHCILHAKRGGWVQIACTIVYVLNGRPNIGSNGSCWRNFRQLDKWCCSAIRDWSLITGRGGGYKMGKSRVRNFLRPPPSRQGKTFRNPLLKSGNFSCPPPTI